MSRRIVTVVRDTVAFRVVGLVEKCPAGDEPCWHAMTPEGKWIGRTDTRKGAVQMVRECSPS